jgi:hypothetical protein
MTRQTGQDWTDTEETIVRQTLAAHVGSQPIGTAPWLALDRRIRRGRQRRVVTLALATVVGVLAVLGLGRGSGLLGTDETAVRTLVAMPTSGSLAGDRAWLDALRAKVTLSFPVTASEVTVLIGADVHDARVALVRLDHIQDGPKFVWYVGAAGAPGSALNATTQAVSAQPAYWLRFGPNLTWPGLTWSGVIVVAPHQSTVTVVDGTNVTDGRLVARGGITATEQWAGVYVASTSSAGNLDVHVDSTRVGGGTWSEHSSGGYGDQSWWATATKNARGSALTTTDALDLADEALRVTGLSTNTPGSQVLFTTTSPNPTAVLALHAPSGAYVIVPVEKLTSRRGGTFQLHVDAIDIHPSSNLDQVSLAWHTLTGGTAVLGPPTATTAELFAATDTTPTRVTLTNGYATCNANNVSHVRFLNTAGHVISQTTVVAQEK